MEEKNYRRYEAGDIVVITDPLSPCENRMGRISHADNEKMRYLVTFEDGFKDTFWYHQIMPYRTEEELDGLINLSLSLGPAAKWMFEEWVGEKKVRFKKK